tara:strand:+ start:97171 stop:97608 length:438 start_codon:yes stop_codon:yes gene_type:complete
MESNKIVKPPVWFWIISIIALLWNIMGAGQYLAQEMMTDEAKTLMTAAQLKLLEETPTWLTAVFAIAVWSGVLASIGLLLRKKWSKSVFLISLIAVIIQMGYSSIMTKTVEVYGSAALIMAIVITLIAALLYYFSNYAIKKKWLN